MFAPICLSNSYIKRESNCIPKREAVPSTTRESKFLWIPSTSKKARQICWEASSESCFQDCGLPDHPGSGILHKKALFLHSSVYTWFTLETKCGQSGAWGHDPNHLLYLHSCTHMNMSDSRLWGSEKLYKALLLGVFFLSTEFSGNGKNLNKLWRGLPPLTAWVGRIADR